AWRIAQPILDTWAKNPRRDFPNYPAGSWGPKSAYELVERDGRRWVEVINRGVLEKVPIFQGTSAGFLHQLALAREPAVYGPGDERGGEMYVVARGEVDVMDGEHVVATLGEGSFFGEVSLLTDAPRTADVRAKTICDLYVLQKEEFLAVLDDHPRFARTIVEA